MQRCLDVIEKRQKWAWTKTSADLLNANQKLALNIVQPGIVRQTYSWQAKPEIDHIFPWSTYVLSHPELVDDIGNMAFLGKLRNIRKSAQPPWEYFADTSDGVLRKDFLIQRELLSADKFEEFVQVRRQAILGEVEDFLQR
jgi:hypothetical protein